MTEIALIIEALALEAGALALSHFQKINTIGVESKGHLDLVTQADKDVESFLTQRIRAAFPDDGVFGEKGRRIKGLRAGFG